MKKITKELIQKFISENEIELSSTHSKLCIPVINRIYRKMTHGLSFSGIKTDGGLICDGHHRYVAALLAGIPIDRVPSVKTSATDIIDWKAVVFLDDEWDTPAKIRILNEQDADFNNISIEELVELLK